MKSPRLPLATSLLASLAAAQATLFERSGPTAPNFGHVCDVVGDTNGDGFGEFLVTVPGASNGTARNAGSVLLYSGLDGSLLATFQGADAGDRLGGGSSAAGDVNGDGFADLCLAAHGDNVPGVGANAGSVRVVSGLDGSVLHTFTGSAAEQRFGLATAPAGDVDGDGHDDLLVARGHRFLMVFSGRDGSLLHEVLLSAQRHAIAGAHDVNGDGFADFAALQELPVPLHLGGMLVSVFSGADGSELWQRGAGLEGACLSGLGDVDGDGFDDVLVGSPWIEASGGRVRCLSGVDGELLFEVFGDHAGDRLGSTVAGAGDLDGDGTPDFAAGLPGRDGEAGADAGAVRAFSGRTRQALFTAEGSTAGGRLGARLSAGRDVNGDGIPDVIASAIPDPESLLPTSEVVVLSFVPRGLEPFGTGSPGCLGSSTLLANGVPALGNAGFALHASNTGALPHLVVGDTESLTGTVFLRALFHLDFAPPRPLFGVVFDAPLPAPDARGSLVAPLALSSHPALLGRTFVFQVASQFPAGRCGQRLATSRGLRVTVQ